MFPAVKVIIETSRLAVGLSISLVCFLFLYLVDFCLIRAFQLGCLLAEWGWRTTLLCAALLYLIVYYSMQLSSSLRMFISVSTPILRCCGRLIKVTPPPVVEKVYVVWSPAGNRPRFKTPVYVTCLAMVMLYVVVLVFMILSEYFELVRLGFMTGPLTLVPLQSGIPIYGQMVPVSLDLSTLGPY